MNKVVVITGGSSGIGKAIGEFLFHKGFTVYGTSRNPEKVTNSIFPLIALDVRNTDSIQQAIEKVIALSKRIDIVINNAGVGITGPIEETPTDEMRNNFETNFFGPIEVIKAVLPQMRKQNSGLIINITSIAGYMGLPYRGIYSASKGALELVSEAISIEVKPFGISVVNIAPGEFATDIASHRYHAPIHEKSVYKTAYENTLGMMNSHMHSGDNPEDLAKVVFQIINDKNPKLHYKEGAFMQKFSIVLKRILPDRIYESMLMNHYKL
ncbi:SDR family oxidoreductase [Flavobacterium sp. N1994]|uniref:SDR family oxidoreductase n=1 Tax=Flavobacterium sp. N1994 TaxID=2986827 RepID=UPI0022212BCF|nr:SDR family oxidoreductase [Flavobacterium sp. N1994]